jgi:hypothetical protein
VIALNSNAFDSYLILESPTGQKLAEDDDGGGFPNAHISYRAEQTGLHRVVVTAFDGQTGPYQLTVQEWGGTTETPKGNDPPPVKKGGGPMPKGKPVDFVPKTFKKPATSAAPKSYFKIVSTPGDSIGQGKSYNFPGNQIMTKKTDRGLNISVSGWTLEVGARAGQFLQPGEYLGAKRYAFSGNAPGLDFFGQGRVNNTLAGEFVVWELEMNGDQVVRLAIDFVQRSEGKGQPLNGKVRINSTFQ